MRSVFASKAPPAAPWSARRAGEEYGQTAEPDWRTVDWAAHLHRRRVDGVDVDFVDLGHANGRPVVFVHGVGGQWQNWLENLPRVAQEHRAVALDLPGHGLTPAPAEPPSISGYGRLVNALCEELGVGRVHLVGNSMGGFVAAEVALQFPERVDRLALVSAAGISNVNVWRFPAELAGRIAGAIAANAAARHRALARRPGTRYTSLALVARYPSKLKPDLVYEGFMKGAGKPGFADAWRANFSYDFRDRLPGIRRPTLIVWGEKDSILSVEDAHEFERLIPDSRKVVMRDTGHIPMAERPEAFNRILLEFLAESGPAQEREPVEGESEPV